MSITDVVGMLDLSGPQGTLSGQLNVSVSGLGALEAPGVDVSGSAAVSVNLDTDTLGAAVSRAAAAAGNLGVDLPDPAALIAPVTRTLELLAPGGGGADPASTLRELLDSLAPELEDRDRDFLSTLEQLGISLGSAPQAQLLRDLLTGVTGGRGELNIGAAVGEALPAGIGALRGIGAAMSLESVLGEGQRLARILEVQLEREALTRALTGVRTGYEVGSFSLERLRAEAAAPSAELLADTLAAVREFRARFGQTVEVLNRGLGFGEATLVHLDVPGLAARVTEYTGQLQAVDTDVVSRGIEAVMSRITPVLSASDLVTAPADSLDGVLTLLETHAAAIAQSIEDVETDRLAEPVASALGAITDVLGTVSEAAEAIVEAVRTALETLKRAVEALPLDELGATLRTALDPVREALEFATNLVADLQTAMEDVAGAATTGLGEAEAAIDAFKTQVDAALGEAASFVESLNLDDVVGRVTDSVGALADALGKAQVKPYFDTAVDGIDTTADVIDAVPLGLLPEDMKADLDAAVAPIRAIDVPATVEEVKGWFQIEDGQFKLRGPLEDAVADVQQQYDDFIEQVEQADPRTLVAPLEEGLAAVREQVERLRFDLELAPLEEAIQRVRDALGAFDIREQLAPVDEAFTSVLSAIDEYSPVALIEPLEVQLDEARERFKELIQLERWSEVLDDLEGMAQSVMDRADPAVIEEGFGRAHAEALRLVDQLQQLRLAEAFGDLVSSLFSGGLPVRGWSVEALGRWLTDGGATEELSARAQAIAASIAATRDAVASVDLPAFRLEVRAGADDLREAVAALPAGPERDQALAMLDGMELDATLARLEVNRSRYASALVTSADAAETLARLGVSQADVTVRLIREAVSPALAFKTAFTQALRIVGIQDLDATLPDIVRSALAVASPARIAAIFGPILTALRGRVMLFIRTLLQPIRDGIAEIESIIDAIDLTPVREGLAEVVAALKAEIEALSPLAILEPTLTAFDGFKAELDAFDPLGPVREVVDGLRETALRILDKLDGEALLEHPITIYDEIMAALRAVSLEALLGPILDQLDALAAQVDDGLDGTSEALVRLQDVLPSGGGGSSVSVGASVAVA